MSNSSQKPVALSPAKRLLGLLAFVVVIVGSISLGLFLSGGFNSPPAEQTLPARGTPGYAMAIMFLVLGMLVIPVGIACYAVVILTNCFTFDFTRPYMASTKGRLWIWNLVSGFFLQVGVSLLIGAFVAVPVSKLLSEQTAFAVCFLGPLIVLQFVTSWFSILTPLDSRLIRRRLLARGITEEQMASGRLMGTSDPAQSSMKRLGSVETDMGVLWINQGELLFRGDTQDWAITHGQLVEIERVADAGSTAAYFGAVHVILRFRYDNGTESRLRLHPEGNWTATGRARALNDIADRLNAWKASPSPGWQTPSATVASPEPIPLPTPRT